MNGFISALRDSGQDHVANIIRRENDKSIMSLEHHQLFCKKRPESAGKVDTANQPLPPQAARKGR